MGLAAVGVVSLATAARADEKVSQLNTALSNTTISGYVDVGAQYTSATGVPYDTGNGSAGANSISLNAVDIALDKPLDATPFSAGYHIELWTGATSAVGATGTATTGTLVRQAYLALGTTVGGQEIDWKIGVWDTIIGYEGLTTASNPNYTHSYGFQLEPTTHTGILGTYKINDSITVQAGVADDSYSAGAYPNTINGLSAKGYASETTLSHPTIMGSVALTAPDSFGPLKGATLTIGGMNTADPLGGYADSLYVGATIPTPISALKFGGAFDYVAGSTGTGSGDIWAAGVYASWTASDKLTFNARAEYLNDYKTGLLTGVTAAGFNQHAEEFTITAQYALWANVLSRLEVRWDHVEYGSLFNITDSASGSTSADAVFAGAQLVYSF